MRLAVAAIACGLVSFLAACGGGPEPPSSPAVTSSSPGPFAPVAATGPFAPVLEAGPFAPTADPGPFAPVADPGPFGLTPAGGGGTPAEVCLQVCARAAELGCPIANCEANCTGTTLAQLPAACHAAYSAWLSCMLKGAQCRPDGGIQGGAGCDEYMTAFERCLRDIAQPNPPVGPVGPVGPQQDGGP